MSAYRFILKPELLSKEYPLLSNIHYLTKQLTDIITIVSLFGESENSHHEKFEKREEPQSSNSAQDNPANVTQLGNQLKTILIAEDIEINFLLLSTYLKKNYTILRAHDGVEAVEIFKEAHPNLVLMDCKMPNMDGLDATKIIHKLSPETPIIMQSAYTFETDRDNAFQAGCIDFISKPIIKDTLMQMLKKYLPA